MWFSSKRFWLFDDPRSYGARAMMRGVVEGLKENGKNVRLYSFNPSEQDAVSKMREDLLQFNPHVVFLANHPASLFLSQLGLKKENLDCSFWIWLFDDPLLMGDEPFDPDEIVLAADPKFISGARSRSAKNIIFLPVAAPSNLSVEYRQEYEAPLAYVGAVMDITSMRNQIQPFVRDYLDRIAEKRLENLQTDFIRLVAQNPIAEGKELTLNGPLLYYLYALTNRIYRMQFIKQLAPLGLKLYGNEVWRPLLKNENLESLFQGPLDPFHEYPHLLASVKINLNLRSLQGFVAPTQRDFLIPMTGGFMLSTKIRQEYFDWPQVDQDNVFQLESFPWSPEFSTPELMLEAVQVYLHKPRFCQEWVDYVQRQFHKNHTFAHRMQQLGMILDHPKHGGLPIASMP